MPDPEPTPDPAQTPDPAATPPAEPPKPPVETDWKAEARKWEDRAKENKKALDAATPKLTEYDKLVAASQSDLEKAQAAAAAATAKITEANTRAVKAQIQRLAADKFVDPDVPFAFIDAAKYVTDDGVDEASIATDLETLLTSRPNLAKPAGSRAPGPNPAQGSSASGAPDLDAQIAQAVKSGDVGLQIRLQNQKLFTKPQ